MPDDAGGHGALIYSSMAMVLVDHGQSNAYEDYHLDYVSLTNCVQWQCGIAPSVWKIMSGSNYSIWG